MALGSGICAASMNLGVAFGEPLLRSATAYGAVSQQAVNAVWLPLLVAGSILNIAYCVYLLSTRHTWQNFQIRQTSSSGFCDDNGDALVF